MIHINYITINLLLNTFCVELLLLPPDGHVGGVPARQGEGLVTVPTGLVVDHEDPVIFGVLSGSQHLRNKVITSFTLER